MCIANSASKSVATQAAVFAKDNRDLRLVKKRFSVLKTWCVWTDLRLVIELGQNREEWLSVP